MYVQLGKMKKEFKKKKKFGNLKNKEKSLSDPGAA